MTTLCKKKSNDAGVLLQNFNSMGKYETVLVTVRIVLYRIA